MATEQSPNLSAYYHDISHVHWATKRDDGKVYGWLKLPPSIKREGDRLKVEVEYVYGEWSEYLHCHAN